MPRVRHVLTAFFRLRAPTLAAAAAAASRTIAQTTPTARYICSVSPLFRPLVL